MFSFVIGFIPLTSRHASCVWIKNTSIEAINLNKSLLKSEKEEHYFNINIQKGNENIFKTSKKITKA